MGGALAMESWNEPRTARPSFFLVQKQARSGVEDEDDKPETHRPVAVLFAF